MKKRLLGVASAALLLSALAVGCSDRMPSAPQTASRVPTQQSKSLLGGLIGGVVGTVNNLLNIVVTLVERPTALSQDIVWSFDAGPGGAISANRQAGLSINVPAGALSQKVHITVTVKAGNVYNYQFAPEGLQFALPVVVTQDVSDNSLIGSLLSGLLGSSKTAKGAYYSAPTLQYDPKTGTATVNELEPTVVGGGLLSFQIRHFSGYTIAMCDNTGFGGF